MLYYPLQGFERKDIAAAASAVASSVSVVKLLKDRELWTQATGRNLISLLWLEALLQRVVNGV